jgi:hypothetical protein
LAHEPKRRRIKGFPLKNLEYRFTGKRGDKSFVLFCDHGVSSIPSTTNNKYINIIDVVVDPYGNWGLLIIHKRWGMVSVI